MQTFQLARQPIVAHLLKAPAAIISGVWALISTLVYAPLYLYHYTFDRLLFAQIFEENNLAYVVLWPLRQLGAAVGLALPLLEIVGVLKLLFVLMPFNSVIIAFLTILSVGLLLMASVQKGCSLVGERFNLPRELKFNAYAILLLQGAQDIMSLILTLFILVTVFQVQKLMDFQPVAYSRRYFGFVCNLAKPVFYGILLAFSACLLTDFLITFTTFTGFTFMSQAKVQGIKAKQAESLEAQKVNEPRKLASAEIIESHATDYLVTLIKVFVYAAVCYVIMQLASRFKDMMKNVRRVQSTKQESEQRKVILQNLESSFDRPQSSIERMPQNVLGEIFSYMHPVEQVRMTQVSHTFRTAVLRKGYFTDLENSNERTKNSLNTSFKHYTNWSSFYEKRTVLLSVLTEVCRAIGNLPYIFLGVLYIPSQILNMSVDPQANLHRMRDAAASLTDDKVYIFEACKFNPANRMFVTPHQRKMLTFFEYKPEHTDKLVANKFLYLGALITYIIQAIFFETAYLFNLPVYFLLKASSYGSMNGIFINPACEETVIIPAYEMEPCIKKILLFVCQPMVLLLTMVWTALLNGLVLRLTWMILTALGVLPQTFNFALAFAVGVSALIWFEYYHLMKAFLVQYFPFFQPARAILCCIPVFKTGFLCLAKATLAMLHSLANKCIASYNKVLTLCLLWSSRKGCLGDVALAAFTSAWMFWPLMLALISMEPIMFIPCGIASSFLVMKGYETTKSIADPTSPREQSSYMNFTQSPV